MELEAGGEYMQTLCPIPLLNNSVEHFRESHKNRQNIGGEFKIMPLNCIFN